jgi:hypothetical protein
LIEAASMTELRRIALDIDHPHGVAVSPDGRLGFISFEGTTEVLGGVVAVDLDSGEVVWRRELGQLHPGVMYLTARVP